MGEGWSGMRKESHWDCSRDGWSQVLAQGGVELRAWKKERNEEIVKYLFFYFLRAVYRCPSTTAEYKSCTSPRNYCSWRALGGFVTSLFCFSCWKPGGEGREVREGQREGLWQKSWSKSPNIWAFGASWVISKLWGKEALASSSCDVPLWSSTQSLCNGPGCSEQELATIFNSSCPSRQAGPHSTAATGKAETSLCLIVQHSVVWWSALGPA